MNAEYYMVLEYYLPNALQLMASAGKGFSAQADSFCILCTFMNNPNLPVTHVVDIHLIH